MKAMESIHLVTCKSGLNCKMLRNWRNENGLFLIGFAKR